MKYFILAASCIAILLSGCGGGSANADSELTFEEKPVPYWLEALKNPDAELRIKATLALAEIGPNWRDRKHVLNALGRIVKDEEEYSEARRGATSALIRFGAAAAPQLSEGLKEPATREDVQESLKAAGEASVLSLQEMLNSESRDVAKTAAETLEMIGPAGRGARPALNQALRHVDRDVRIAAALALGSMDLVRKDAIPALCEAMRDGNKDIRNRAVKCLGKIGPETLQILQEAVRDEEYIVRSSAYEALGKFGPVALPVLRQALNSRDLVNVFAALDKIGKPAIPILVDALRSESSHLPQAASGTMERITLREKGAIVPTLVNLLVDSHPTVRQCASKMLGVIGPEAGVALASLAEALKDQDPVVRKNAVVALGSIGPEASKAIQALTPLVGDEVAEVRLNAVMVLRSLAQQDEVSVAHALTGALKVDDPILRKAAIRGLTEIGSEAKSAVPALSEALLDMNLDIRLAVLDALQKIGLQYDQELVQALIGALKDTDAEVCSKARDSLVQLGPPVIPDVIKLLGDQNSDVRFRAVDILKVLKRHAQPALIAALKAENVHVRKGAAEALKESGAMASGAVPVLLEILESEKSVEVRKEVVEALGAIGSRANAAIPVLEKIEGNDSEHPAVRKAAERALYLIRL